MRACAIALALALVTQIGTAAELPEGTTENIVSIQVNGHKRTNVEVVQQRGTHFYFTSQQLQAWGVLVPETPGYLSTEDLGIRPEFNASKQALNLIVPAGLLPMQTFGEQDNLPTSLAPQPKGVMVDYDVAARVDNERQVDLSLGHQVTTGLATGALTTTGQLNATQERVEYIRGVTTWQKDIMAKGVVVQVGDVFTSRNAVYGTVNLAGIRVASDPELRGGRLKAVPIIGGLADTRSTAEIYVNAVKRHQLGVDQGPFEFRQLALQEGMNQVELVIHDEFGRTSSLVRDVYVTRSNLPKGTTEWSVTAGLVREGRSTGNTYSTPALDAQVVHGVNDRLTLGVSVQATQDSQNVTGSAAINLGKGGGLTLHASQSQSPEGTGTAYAVGWEKRTNQWSFTANHMQRTGKYWDLNQAIPEDLRIDVQRASVVGVNWHSEDGNWIVSGMANDITYDEGRHTNTVGARVRWQPSSRSTWTFGASQDLAAQNTSVGVTYGLRFGDRGRYTSNLNVRPAPLIPGQSERADNYNATLSNTLTNQIMVGNQVWDYSGTVAYDQAVGPAAYGSATTHTNIADIRVDAYGNEDDQWITWRVEGSVWLGEGGIAMQPKTGGTSFVVAEVPGQANVLVKVGGMERTTNKNGIAVVPGMAPLRNNSVSIDTSRLPMEVRIPSERKEVGTPRIGGAKVVFEVKSESMREFAITIDGTTPEPPAAVISGGERVPVGSGGVFVLNDPTPGASLTIEVNKTTCTTTLPQSFGSVLNRTELACTTGETK